MRRFAVLALLTAVALVGCKRGSAPRGGDDVISRARFIAANAAVRSVPDTAANADSLRAAALARYRVTEEDLRAFVAAHWRDAALMAEVWQEIARRVESADSARLARQYPTPPPTERMDDLPEEPPPPPREIAVPPPPDGSIPPPAPKPDTLRSPLIPPGEGDPGLPRTIGEPPEEP